MRSFTARDLPATDELCGRVYRDNRNQREALARCGGNGPGEVAMRDAAIVANGLLAGTRATGPPHHRNVPAAESGRVPVGDGKHPAATGPAGARLAVEADVVGLGLLDHIT